MKKNVASQVVGAQMVSATDGSAFTGSVTVSVTGDGGTQATGSVGSGACTHEGNGFHTYAPAQAETNYDHVAFTFTATGAVPATVQIYTSFPQTGDGFARLGAPAGASVSVDIAAVKTQTAAIEVDTQDIQGRLPAALVSGRIDASVGAMAANVITAAATAADFTTEVTAGLSTLDAAGVRTAVGLAAANLDTQLSAIDDYLDTEVAAIKAKTDNLPASPAATGDIPTAAAIADAVWDEAIAGHAGAGSTGEALAAAGAAGDPWITALPGGYSAGQAGYIVAAIAADAAAADLRGERTVARGTVTTGGSTTSIPTSAFTPAGAAADQFKGRIVIFDIDTATAALRGQATDITASSNSATPTLTVTELTTAPASGDTFTVV